MMERSRSNADIIGVFQRQFRDLQKQVDTLRNYDRSIPDWITLTLTSAWVPFSGGEPGAEYWRDAAGIVRLHGIIKNGALASTMFTLPVGFRPITNSRFAVPSNSAFGWIIILTDGTAQLLVGSNLWVDLSGISFRAEK